MHDEDVLLNTWYRALMFSVPQKGNSSCTTMKHLNSSQGRSVLCPTRSCVLPGTLSPCRLFSRQGSGHVSSAIFPKPQSLCVRSARKGLANSWSRDCTERCAVYTWERERMQVLKAAWGARKCKACLRNSILLMGSQESQQTNVCLLACHVQGPFLFLVKLSASVMSKLSRFRDGQGAEGCLCASISFVLQRSP